MNLIDLLISSVLSLVMFGIGCSLSFRDIKNVFKNLKLFLTGITLQMVFLPLFAFIIAYCSNLPAELKVGLFIVSICPGGATSNFISYIVNANTALSIALTSVNSILILFTIPILSNQSVLFFTGNTTDIELEFIDMFSQVFTIIILPALLGLVINKYYKKTVAQLRTPLKIINVILLALVFGIKFFANEKAGGSGISTQEILQLLPYCLGMHIGALAISYLSSKYLTKVTNSDATTIGIEVGLQNTTLALLVTGTLLHNVEMTKPALVFALFTFFTTMAFALLTTPSVWRKKA